MDKEKNQFEQNNTQEPRAKSQSSSWKKFLGKKWVFPAVYLAAAALILALIFWYQDPNRYAIDQEELMPELVQSEEGEDLRTNTEEPAVTVATPEETIGWPVASELSFTIARSYFDDQATDEEKSAAVVQYADGYWPNTGIDITVDGKETFDVLAAASGEVIRAEKDPVVGNQIVIQHDNNRVTVYSSLQDLNVAVGDKINKGDVIGKAGRNAFGKDLGVHLHFEVKVDGQTVNPLDYLPEQG